MDGPAFEFMHWQDISFFQTVTPLLRRTLPPTRGVPGLFSEDATAGA
jgi:hypothetical protein